MSGYLISEYVHVHATPDATILLDLRADRYHGLDREQTRALALLVEGWPFPADSTRIDEKVAADLTRELMEHGLITTDRSRGKSAAPLSLTPVQERLFEWDSSTWPTIRAIDVYRMTLACAQAATSLRLRRFEQVVRAVQNRKALRAGHRPSSLDAARHAAAVFRALRPLYYTAYAKCLLDSLALVEFMASYDLFPTWVIGVRPMPFAAHSWIQIDHFILNGSSDYARAFAPIMAI